MKSNKYMRIAVILIAVLLTANCAKVSPGHVGIVVNQYGSEKGVSDYTPTTGTFFYNPITTSVLEYPTYIQNVVWTHNPNEGSPNNEEITFSISGNMAMKVDVSLAYSLDHAKVPHFYVQFRNDDLNGFTHGFLHNVTRDCFNELGGKYDLDHIMGDNADFIHAVREEVQKRVGVYGVNIQQFGIIGVPRPPDDVLKAINAKIGATQLAIQKQNELVQAEAEAKKVIARAEGDAKANLLLASSITPQLIQWQTLELQRISIAKWNGQLPQYNGTSLPFIMK